MVLFILDALDIYIFCSKALVFVPIKIDFLQLLISILSVVQFTQYLSSKNLKYCKHYPQHPLFLD